MLNSFRHNSLRQIPIWKGIIVVPCSLLLGGLIVFGFNSINFTNPGKLPDQANFEETIELIQNNEFQLAEASIEALFNESFKLTYRDTINGLKKRNRLAKQQFYTKVEQSLDTLHAKSITLKRNYKQRIRETFPQYFKELTYSYQYANRYKDACDKQVFEKSNALIYELEYINKLIEEEYYNYRATCLGELFDRVVMADNHDYMFTPDKDTIYITLSPDKREIGAITAYHQKLEGLVFKKLHFKVAIYRPFPQELYEEDKINGLKTTPYDFPIFNNEMTPPKNLRLNPRDCKPLDKSLIIT